MTARAPDRESRKAAIKRALARIFAEHELGPTDIERQTGAPRQHVAQWIDPAPKLKSMSIADAAALEHDGARCSVAALIAGDGYAVVELPRGEESALGIEHAARLQRETSDVLTAHLRAIADGRVTRAESAPLRKEIREAIEALCALDRALVVAEAEGVVSVSEKTERVGSWKTPGGAS